jgi:cell division protein FtsW (lipid II flippase)
MDKINPIISVAEEVLARFPTQTTPMEAVALAVVLIGVLAVLSALPPRIVTVLAALSSLGLLVLLAPSHWMILLAIGCGLAGLMHYRRQSAMMQRQLDGLSRSVRELELVANRWLIHSLNSPTALKIRVEDRATPSIVPTERGDQTPAQMDRVSDHREK